MDIKTRMEQVVDIKIIIVMLILLSAWLFARKEIKAEVISEGENNIENNANDSEVNNMQKIKTQEILNIFGGGKNQQSKDGLAIANNKENDAESSVWDFNFMYKDEDYTVIKQGDDVRCERTITNK